MLLYWPLMGAVFWSLELFADWEYHPVYSPLDDKIPFIEYFVVPYYFWFLYIIGSMIYFFFLDKLAFVKYTWSVIITHTVTLIVYILYPTCQELRPQIEADSLCTYFISKLYGYDTNTNVCPSIHVIGSFSVYFAALKSEHIKSRIIKLLYLIANILICLSTVFIKQHSVIDLILGVILSLAVYPFVFADSNPSRKLCMLFYPQRYNVNNIKRSVQCEP